MPLYQARYIVNTMIWVLHCCKKSGISNFCYLFYGWEFITKAVSKSIMTLQGHPRSLILAPNESAYGTSY